MTRPIYLDYNGTTPIDKAVFEAMMPFLETEFGNPSSSNFYAIEPKKALEKARRQIAGMLNCESEEIIFTSGGTESNNHAIKGIAFALRDKGNHIITSMIEHPAVFEVCRFLEKWGFITTYLPVDKYGLVNPDDLEKEIRPETILITIMHANNEVGTIQPIEEIADIAGTKKIAMHTDTAQSIGKLQTDVKKMKVDLLSIAGHKIYAPKGIGALYIKRDLILEKFCHGAGQEMRQRAGTQNVAQIVGLGKACEIICSQLEENINHMKMLRDCLHSGLSSGLDNIKLNGHPKLRLCNTLSLSFKDLEANRILEEIGLEVAASAGAACHSDKTEISHVLEAMGVPVQWAKGTLRFSVGRMTTKEEINKAISVIVDSVKRLDVQQTYVNSKANNL
jgi:cysteine desulfurase